MIETIQARIFQAFLVTIKVALEKNWEDQTLHTSLISWLLRLILHFMFQNVAMTSHIGKKSGLVPAASVTTATPAPGKGTGHSPSPFYGGHMVPNPNLDPPPPFLFVDSLKPIEIVVSFTALSKWLDPPQPIIRERDKEKEKDSNSVLTGQGMVISLNYLFPFFVLLVSGAHK